MDLGSCREVIEDGQTGFLVNNVDEAVRALERLSEIDRNACRQRVQECFSIETMVEAYERVYRRFSNWKRKMIMKPTLSDDTLTTPSSPKPISPTRGNGSQRGGGEAWGRIHHAVPLPSAHGTVHHRFGAQPRRIPLHRRSGALSDSRAGRPFCRL
jgi:hypothetical protein